MKEQLFIYCKVCNKQVRIYPSNLKGRTKKVYCSKACQNLDYKTRFTGEANPNYIHGPKHCIDCNTPISKNAKERCRPCKFKSQEGEKNGFFGKTHTDDFKKYISKTHKGRVSTFKGMHHSDSSKQKLSQAKKNEWATATDAHKQKYLDGLQKACLNQLTFKQTIPEKMLEDLLVSNDIKYERNKSLYNKFLVDFSITGTNIIVEVFGDYWHGNKVKFPKPNSNQLKQINKDKSRLAYLRKCGHKVIVLWENQILSKDGRISSLLTRILSRQKKLSFPSV